MDITKLNKTQVDEFRNLIEIFKEVFENDLEIPDNKYLGSLLSDSNFLVFVVIINGKIVGGLTIFVLHGYYGSKPIAYIYDVGISPSFQGKGLGKELIAEVCRFCKENGFEDAYVEAESDDIDAVNFYRQTKYSSETKAIHFTYKFSD